jgi:hypothetical protein
MWIVVLFAATLALAACEPAGGARTIDGAYIGEPKCSDVNPNETKIVWDSLAKTPSRQQWCKYGDRSIEHLTFANHAYVIAEYHHSGYFLVNDEAAFESAWRTEFKGQVTLGKVLRVQGTVGPVLYAKASVQARDCLVFEIFFGATTALRGGGMGAGQKIKGLICRDAGTPAADFETDAVNRIKGLKLRG